MSEDHPEWVPTIDEAVDATDQQETIITADAYPMRVLAGAGTGKTFTMVRKIDHLIDEEGVSPDRILALTFTNNAADSMREKLNARLGTAGYDIDAYTYHSICNEILTDYAYEAGIDPDFEIVSDAEQYAIVLEVLDEIDYRWVKPNVYGPDSWGSGAASKLLSFIGSMKRSGISPDAIDAFLGPADRLYDLEDLSDRIETIASDHLGGRSVGSVHDGLADARAAIAAERETLGTTGVETAVADFLDRLLAVCDALDVAFEAHEAGDRTLPEDAHKLPKYLLGGYSAGAPSGIPSMDLELPDQLATFIEECLTARDLVDGYAAYEQTLADRDLLDFDGLVVKTMELLDGEAGGELASRWEYVFCDEFQDTDRLQFELVTSLVSDERVFVVGDDDQAIYEWRGAHVANITDELTATYGDTLADEPLEENFRSRQPILDLANDLLDRLGGREDGKTLTRVDEPDYDGDAVAVIEEADDDSERAEQLMTVTRNLLSGDAPKLDQAYEPGDIAVLVKKNDHAAPLIDAFDRAGIPYQVAGDLATESIGVGTVVAYLKALARPEADEVSWNRVLTMRYRLTDGDLRRLNDYDEDDDDACLLDELLTAPLAEFDEPERVREARTHVSQLLDTKTNASLGRLYSELKDVTDIEWYLSDQERRDLTHLDDIIDQYGQGAVQPPLTAEFIDSLRHYESLFAESGSAPTDQPELADDAVNIMTIHKSKGLDFPVVLMPRVTADQWEPSSRTYDALETGLSDGSSAVFDADFIARDARETRRVLHVGITRAEDILVLQGGRDEEDDADDDADPHPMTVAVDEILPASIPWDPERGQLPLWQDIQECLPPSAAEWTDTLASTTVGQIGGTVQYDESELTTEAAREHVLDLAGASLAGDLADESTHDRTTLRVDALTGPTTPRPALSHSYTSLEAYEECARKHYLEYVVNAFPDYREQETTSTTDDGVSQREVGLLFHDVAEQAAHEGAQNRTAWYEICERRAGQRRAPEALSPAKQCIDRYFELEVSNYEILEAEREFHLNIDGHELMGFIDAVYRTPADELLVIDYKATERHRDLQEDKQLPIYLLACQDLYDEPVRRAGYAYVGAIGPKVETRTFTERELQSVRSDIQQSLAQIADLSYNEYTAGEHCRWCPHNQLPCAPDSLQTD